LTYIKEISMARTPSNMVDLGSACPDFCLIDTDQNQVKLKDFEGSKGLLVIFMCNHCPFVIHLRSAIAAFANEYLPQGLKIVGINSNDVIAYPEDHPNLMKVEKDLYYPFPYLFDETQDVAKAFKAACTPDFFLYDASFKLAYRGQFDGSRPGLSIPVNGAHLRAACDSLLVNGYVDSSLVQLPSLGCNLKWKS
jgi:peroxiredoxin